MSREWIDWITGPMGIEETVKPEPQGYIKGVAPALSTETPSNSSDGSSADYYKLPEGCTQLQDLIAYRNMNAQIGEIFRAVYRYGQVAHSPRERDLKKIIFYAQAELDRLAKYESAPAQGETK